MPRSTCTGHDTAPDAAHRPIAILAVSAEPNPFVVTLHHENQTMLALLALVFA